MKCEVSKERWRKFQDDEIHIFYFSQNITKMGEETYENQRGQTLITHPNILVTKDKGE